MPGKTLFYKFCLFFYRASANMPINLALYFLLNINCGGFSSIISSKISGISNFSMLIIIVIGSLWFLVLALESGLANFILIFSDINGKNRLIIALKLLISFLKTTRSILQIFGNRYNNFSLNPFKIFLVYLFLFIQYL